MSVARVQSDDEADIVTDEFRREVRLALERNKIANRAAGRTRDPDRPPDDQASLARAINADKTLIGAILGPVRETSQIKRDKLVERSSFVPAIRRVLELRPTRTMSVPEELDSLVRQWDAIGEDAQMTILGAFERALEHARRRSR